MAVDIKGILGQMRLISANTKTWWKFIVLIIVVTGSATAGAVIFSKTKTKVDQSCEQERARLINFITEMNKDLATSYIPT